MSTLIIMESCQADMKRVQVFFFFLFSYQAGVEIHGTLQIPFLSIRARIDLSIALPPSSSFRLDASLVLDPIDYFNGLIKIVDANSDSQGAHLRMVITEQISDLLIDGSCRVS